MLTQATPHICISAVPDPVSGVMSPLYGRGQRGPADTPPR